jgi:hypothetical protein
MIQGAFRTALVMSSLSRVASDENSEIVIQRSGASDLSLQHNLTFSTKPFGEDPCGLAIVPYCRNLPQSDSPSEEEYWMGPGR